MARQITSLLAACRVAEARQIVADQRTIIASLADQLALEAEGSLQTYLSALTLLEAHERRIREENRTIKGETRKRRAA